MITVLDILLQLLNTENLANNDVTIIISFNKENKCNSTTQLLCSTTCIYL
jgi:hypothetical protein